MNIRKTNKAVSKKIDRIENSLKSKLTAFYRKNIKNSDLPLLELKRRYETQIKTLIRKTIQDSYLEGNNLVGDTIAEKNKDFTLFISVTDVQNIQALTNKMISQFWTTTSKLLLRENSFIKKLNTNEFEKRNPFDDKAAMIGLSALFAWSGFNSAVMSKMTNIPILTPVTLPPITNDPIDLELGFGLERIPDELPLSGKVMFLTQEDIKVDPEICEPLNRTVYDVVLDVDIPEPPLHRFCRCRLIPIVDNVDLGVTAGEETIL